MILLKLVENYGKKEILSMHLSQKCSSYFYQKVMSAYAVRTHTWSLKQHLAPRNSCKYWVNFSFYYQSECYCLGPGVCALRILFGENTTYIFGMSFFFAIISYKFQKYHLVQINFQHSLYLHHQLASLVFTVE